MKLVVPLLTSCLFIFSLNLCYSQKITKPELRRIIKKSQKGDDCRFSKFISNNTDSIFFKSKIINVYTSVRAASKEGFCNTIELRFLKKNMMNFIDCQTCKEPSSCRVSTVKDIYEYSIKKIKGDIYIFFKNDYDELKFKLLSAHKNSLYEHSYIKLALEKIHLNTQY